MTIQSFINTFAQIVTVDPSTVTPDTRLDSLSGWDSMGKVAFLSFLDNEFKVELAAGLLDQCHKVSDLIDLAKGQITKD